MIKNIVEALLVSGGLLLAGRALTADWRSIVVNCSILVSCTTRIDSQIFAWLPAVVVQILSNQPPFRRSLDGQMWPVAAIWAPACVLIASTDMWDRSSSQVRLSPADALHVLWTFIAASATSVYCLCQSNEALQVLQQVSVQATVCALCALCLRDVIRWGRRGQRMFSLSRLGLGCDWPPRSVTGKEWDPAHLLLLSQGIIAGFACCDVLAQRVHLSIDWARWRDGADQNHHEHGDPGGWTTGAEVGGHVHQDQQMTGAAAALLLAAGLCVSVILMTRYASGQKQLVGTVSVIVGLLSAQVLASWWLGEEALAWAARAVLFPLTHRAGPTGAESRLLAQPQGQPHGQGMGKGQGQEHGQGMGQGQGQEHGQGMGQGQGQGHGHGMGQGQGQEHGHGMGQGHGQEHARGTSQPDEGYQKHHHHMDMALMSMHRHRIRMPIVGGEVEPVGPMDLAESLRWRRPALLVLWVAACCLLVAVGRLVVQGRCMRRIVARKLFHAVASGCIAAGWWFDRPLAQLALASALLGCALVEAARWSGMLGPIATRCIDAVLKPLSDSRDASGVIMSHVYLLVGCSSPILLLAAVDAFGQDDPSGAARASGMEQEHAFALSGWRGWTASYKSAARELLPLVGVLAVGIGDAAAAAVGSTLGRWKLPLGGSPKTAEGTLACAVSIAVAAAGWLWLTCAGAPGWGALMLCAQLGVWISLLEAYCTGVDNLGLPIAGAVWLAMNSA